MSTDRTPGSRSFPDAPAVPTAAPEIQRLRAAVEAKLLGGPVAPVRVGRFVILERVGEGAMGVVYAAYDAELDRKVAIKILRPSGDDPGVHAGLLREAQAMARLSHPNVVGVFEVGRHEGSGFVAMEFVRGKTLRQWQSDATRSQAEILEHYQQAGRGLAAAHAADVVHRDFKPDNVLVGADGRVRVVDFGLARTQSTTAAPEAGLRAGTPGYMAPEQILGATNDARSDQFAFCVALWEALTGARPFAGKTADEVFEAVLFGSIRAPPRAALPSWIEGVLRVGLAAKPDERHPTMNDLLRALAADPRHRRRRRVAVVVGAVVVLATTGALQVRAAMRARACAAAGDAIDEIWNDRVEDRARSSLAATGAANAATTADKAIPRLNDYVHSWRTAAAATCTAIEIDNVLDTAAAESATSCLAERLEAVKSLVSALAHADASIVDNAVRSVLQLPPAERCTDARALALDLRPPTDPEQRAELRRIQSEMAGAETLRRLGRATEALERLEAQVDAAAALQWPAIQARLNVEMGRLQINLGAPDRALELGEQGFLLAYRAGDDATAALSASMLIGVFAMQKAQPEQAQHWDDLAAAAIGRMVSEQLHVELSHATAQGRRWLAAGDLERSEVALQRALDLGERLHGVDHLVMSDALIALATVQCRRDDHVECEATYERALATLSEAVGDDHPWTARALAGLGFAEHRVGDSARALTLLDAALAIDERHFGPNHLNVAVDLSYTAVVLQESGAALEAIAKLDRALVIMKSVYPPDHPEIELLLGNLGRAQHSAGDLTAARSSLEQALAMHARSSAPDEATRVGNEASLARVVHEQSERGR